jgi:hypothetical protein
MKGGERVGGKRGLGKGEQVEWENVRGGRDQQEEIEREGEEERGGRER